MIFIDFQNLLNDKGQNLYSILASCRRILGASLLFEKGIEKIVKWYLFSKITPSLFVDKASCTRQFESKLSLHSLASLFPLKEGSTSHLGLLPSGKKRETALLGARNRFALRLAGHQSPRQILCGMGPPYYNLLLVCAIFCGMGPPGNSSLQFTVNSLQFTVDFVVIC